MLFNHGTIVELIFFRVPRKNQPMLTLFVCLEK